MTKLLDGFFLLRIPLLAPVWTVVLLGWITACGECRLGGYLAGASLAKASVMWITLVGFSLIVASIYVVNQIADIESDRINHKLFILPQGLLSIPTAWVLAAVCALTGLAIAALMLDWIMVGLYGMGLFLGYLYNLPPAALKGRAIGGTVANFLGHGMVTYLVGWYAAHLGTALTSQSIWSGLAASLTAAFANAAVYLTTTIADLEGDRLTGKNTFCVTFGAKATAMTSALFCVAAFGFAFLLSYHAWVMIVPSVASIVVFGLLVVSVNRENAFKAFKWPVFLLTFCVALFVPAYALLILATFFGSRLYYRRRFGIDYPTFRAQ